MTKRDLFYVKPSVFCIVRYLKSEDMYNVDRHVDLSLVEFWTEGILELWRHIQLCFIFNCSGHVLYACGVWTYVLFIVFLNYGFWIVWTFLVMYCIGLWTLSWPSDLVLCTAMFTKLWTYGLSLFWFCLVYVINRYYYCDMIIDCSDMSSCRLYCCAIILLLFVV